jgi:methionyl-tRNA formyltransferase
MRVAFFGTSGIITLAPLQAVSREHEVVLFARPGQRPSLLRRVMARRDPLNAFITRQRIATAWMRTPDDARFLAQLRDSRPDIICISTFRWLLSEEVLSAALRGGVNLHSSLLPRHRGALPLFWIFHSNDRESGVTVHRLTTRADAGAILGQERWPLARGTTAVQLNDRNAERGAQLLARVLGELASGSEQAVAQNEAEATRAPKVPQRGQMIDFETWPAERVWHFLNGVHPFYVEEIGAAYAAVLGWRESTSAAMPGSVSNHGAELLLHCRDGVVRLRSAR